MARAKAKFERVDKAKTVWAAALYIVWGVDPDSVIVPSLVAWLAGVCGFDPEHRVTEHDGDRLLEAAVTFLSLSSMPRAG